MSQYPLSSYNLGEPLGHLVDVSGWAVHVYGMGQTSGRPTVWLENGLLGTTLGWGALQTLLAHHTRVMAYDRAGTGWTSPRDIYRTAQNEADEFTALLDALGERDPIIIVAWSAGGLVARAFAADHPERVAGLVLLDATPPNYDAWAIHAYPDRYWQETQTRMEQIRGFAELATHGQLTREHIAGWITPSVLEQHGQRYLRLILNSPHYWWTYYWQNQFAVTRGAQVQRKQLRRNLPLQVMVASQLPADPDPYQQATTRMWQTMQLAVTTQTDNVTVTWLDAGHAIHREQPQSVVNAVLAIIREVA